MDEYLDLLKVYYNEKQIFLTKGKHKKCLECEHDKQFIETGGELIFSCGDVKSDKSKCGNKIRIELPIYKSEKDLTYFKNSLQKTINWEVIGKYIDANSKGKDDNIALKKKYDDELKSIKGLFNKYNLKNTELIKDNYKKITKLKNESKIILTEMKLIENKSKISLLKKQYIENLNNIQTLNREIRDLNDNIEYYFMTDEPKLPAKGYNPGIIDSKQNKKKVKDKVEVIDDTFKEGDEVKWMSGKKELTGKIDNITSKSYMICCKPDGKMYRVKKELVSLNKEEPVETVEEPQADAPAEKSLEPVEITIGSKVKWTKDGKDLNGEIESITSKSYIICCKPGGKLYRIKKELVSLNDLPESEAPDVEDEPAPDVEDDVEDEPAPDVEDDVEEEPAPDIEDDVEDEPAPDIEDDAPPDVEDDEVEQDEPPVEDKELVIGSKVKWIKNKKILEGVIDKITQKSIIVCCKSAKINYRLPIDTKFI
jgi:hypothetical protein